MIIFSPLGAGHSFELSDTPSWQRSVPDVHTYVRTEDTEEGVIPPYGTGRVRATPPQDLVSLYFLCSMSAGDFLPARFTGLDLCRSGAGNGGLEHPDPQTAVGPTNWHLHPIC